MLDRYTINERLKRIEPKDTLCQFCNKSHSTKMDDNYFIPLYKIRGRTELIVYNSVKFNKISIGIPRCNLCCIIHTESSYNAWLISLVSAIVLIILGFIILGAFGLFASIPLVVLGVVIPPFLTDYLVRAKGILSQKDGAKKDPLVKEMVISGWSLTTPSPMG